jgi:hypothetical protein
VGRSRELDGGNSKEEAFNADVLVGAWPVDTFTVSNEPPLRSDSGRGFEYAREPNERCRHSTAIGKRDDQLVVRNLHVEGKRLVPKGRGTHARPQRN